MSGTLLRRTAEEASGEVRAGRWQHEPALDGLRGAAVAAVLWFHAGHLTGGYLGVDLFFVLSGYLITSLLVLEWQASGTISLRSFWVRRARRLLPALLLVLLVVAIGAHWWVNAVSLGQLRGEGFATLLYVANWYQAYEGNGYWHAGLLPSWLQHTWSLAIEEQFYLVWPLVTLGVLSFGRRRQRQALSSTASAAPTGASDDRPVRRLLAVAVIGTVASAGLMIVRSLLGADANRLYLGTDTRAAAVLLGACLACWRQTEAGRRPLSEPLRVGLNLVAMVAAVGLGVAWLRLSGTSVLLYRGLLFACGVAAVAVLADLVTPGASMLRRLLSIRPLCWLGLISYGLYLWHWPIFQYFNEGRYGLSGWLLTFVQVGVSLVVAVLSYRFVEQPIRRQGIRRSFARVAVPAALLVTAGVLVLGTRGAIDPIVSSTVATSAYSGKASTPKVMVIGDSVGYGLAAEGVVPQAGALGIQAINRASIGCTLTRDVGDAMTDAIRNCSPEWPADARRYRPDVVLVVFGGWPGVVPGRIDGRSAWPCQPLYDRTWRQRLEKTVDVFADQGAKVVLVTAPTAADPRFMPPDRAEFHRRGDCADEITRSVGTSYRDASTVDLATWICPTNETCRDTIDGVVVRADELHFRGDGARLVARWLVPRALAAAGSVP